MWGVVINPISGKNKGVIFGSQVTSYLASVGAKYQIISGTSAAATSDSLRKFLAAKETVTGIVAVGGDGLAHLVIQALAGTKIPCAFIPAGTGNDVVRALGWPLNDVEAIMHEATTSAASPIDLGLVDGEWFSAVLSTGFDSIVNERANALKWPIGPMKYNLAMVMQLPGFKPSSYTIILDDQEIHTQAMLIAIANGKSYGGGMLVCPQASMRDGKFDVMVLAPVSIPEFLRVFPRVFKGTHISHPAVTIYRTRAITVMAEAVAYADGERVGSLPVSAECISNALYTWAR